MRLMLKSSKFLFPLNDFWSKAINFLAIFGSQIIPDLAGIQDEKT